MLIDNDMLDLFKLFSFKLDCLNAELCRLDWFKLTNKFLELDFLNRFLLSFYSLLI